MSVLGNREIGIPKHIDIYHLTRETSPSDKTALECVMEVDQVRLHLEKEAEELALSTSDGNPYPSSFSFTHPQGLGRYNAQG